MRPALFALVTLSFPIARHSLLAELAERRASRDILCERDDPHFLKVNAAFLVTPDRDHFVSRNESADDVPESFCRLVGHTPYRVISIRQGEGDVTAVSCGRHIGNYSTDMI